MESKIITRIALITCWPEKTIGLPLINPWSLPKAIKLPEKVSVPIKTDNTIVPDINVVRYVVPCLVKNSAAATRADAPPPNPLKIATIWGICVI